MKNCLLSILVVPIGLSGCEKLKYEWSASSQYLCSGEPLDISWKTSKKVDLALYNVNGQVVRQWHRAKSGSFHIDNVTPANIPIRLKGRYDDNERSEDMDIKIIDEPTTLEFELSSATDAKVSINPTCTCEPSRNCPGGTTPECNECSESATIPGAKARLKLEHRAFSTRATLLRAFVKPDSITWPLHTFPDPTAPLQFATSIDPSMPIDADGTLRDSPLISTVNVVQFSSGTPITCSYPVGSSCNREGCSASVGYGGCAGPSFKASLVVKCKDAGNESPSGGSN